MEAKQTSRLSMVIAGLWIVILTLMKGYNLIQLEVSDIVYSGMAIAGVFSPIYLSIFLDKIRDIKFGNKE